MPQMLRFTMLAFVSAIAATSNAAAQDGPQARSATSTATALEGAKTQDAKATTTDGPKARDGKPMPPKVVLLPSSPVKLLTGVTDLIAAKLNTEKISTIGQVAVAPLPTVVAAAGPVLAPKIIAQAKMVVETQKSK